MFDQYVRSDYDNKRIRWIRLKHPTLCGRPPLRRLIKAQETRDQMAAHVAHMFDSVRESLFPDNEEPDEDRPPLIQ